MDFDKKFTYSLKKLNDADVFNKEFTSQMLTNLIKFYGIWKIGVIVTCKERLIKRFGADDYKNEIHPRLLRLAYQLKAIILDVCTDDFKVVDKRIKALRTVILQLIDNRIKALEAKMIKPFLIIRKIRYIQIIGDHDIVPFAELPNNADGDILYTDDVYADFTGDEVIDVPIARIPDGKSLDLLIKQLDGTSIPKPGAFGLGNSRRPYAGPIMEIFDDAADVYWSLPMTSDDFSVSDVDVEYIYFILHGSKSNTSIWFGEEPTYPIAFETNLAACHGTLLTGCCYGAYIIGKTPADSICLRFLRSGIKAFIGCTGIHYSTIGDQTDDYGPLFHRLFFEYLMAGNKPSRAFLKAKRAYSELADSNVEDKILHEFVFYGRL